MNPHIARATLLVQQERFELAQRELALALADDPNDADAHRLLAQCLAAEEKFAPATQAAQTAVALEPDQALSHYVLGYVWLARNHFDEAAASASEAVRLDPDDPDYYTLLASVRLAQKQWPEALAADDAALAIDSEHVGAINNRAAALRGLGYRDDAQAQLRAALTHSAENAHTHANLGWNYLHQGDSKAAEKHFREALRLDPDNEWAREGVLESIKSRNVFYRLILKYFFWMQTKTAGHQWVILIVAYIAYRFVFSAAQKTPQLGWFLWPLVWAYIVFAVATWLAVPLANLFVWLHPFGRLALRRSEKIESLVIAVTLLALAGLHIAAAVTDNDIVGLAALLMLILSVSIAMTVVSRVPQARRIMVGYTVIVILLMAAMAGSLWVKAAAPDTANAIGAQSLLTLTSTLVRYSGLIAVLLANLLAMQDWKR